MRTAIGLSYDGSRFGGWQSQPSGNTIQDCLEAAIAAIAGEPVRITGAGRTDAGVHALAQVAHFDFPGERPASAWVRGVNAGLPPQIAVQWAVPVGDGFNARFSAFERSYRYVLYNRPERPGLGAGYVGWFHHALDVARMQEAAQCLVGEHDFSAFRSSECQAKSPVKQLKQVTVTRKGPYVQFDFLANAFLHHMVRNIVGCLVYVGKGKHAPGWMGELLLGRDRKLAAPTFAPDGLYLSGIRYEAHWHLPEFVRMMPFDPDCLAP